MNVTSNTLQDFPANIFEDSPTPKTDELISYQELIDKKARQNSNEILPNAGNLHAAIVMSKLFEKTNNTIKMVVGSLDGSISDQPNYLRGLKKCLDKNIEFQILFLDKPNQQSLSYQILTKYKDSHHPVSFALASTKVRQRFLKNGKEVHFSVFDEHMYRFEKDTKKYLAWVCFNDETNAKQLVNIFDSVFKESAIM